MYTAYEYATTYCPQSLCNWFLFEFIVQLIKFINLTKFINITSIISITVVLHT